MPASREPQWALLEAERGGVNGRLTAAESLKEAIPSKTRGLSWACQRSQ